MKTMSTCHLMVCLFFNFFIMNKKIEIFLYFFLEMISNSGSEDHDSLILTNGNYYNNINTNNNSISTSSNSFSSPINNQQMEQFRQQTAQSSHLSQLTLLNDNSQFNRQFSNLSKGILLDSPTEKSRFFDLTSTSSSMSSNTNNCFNTSLIGSSTSLIELNGPNMFIDNKNNLTSA
jgi:hypothetical protein